MNSKSEVAAEEEELLKLQEYEIAVHNAKVDLYNEIEENETLRAKLDRKNNKLITLGHEIHYLINRLQAATKSKSQNEENSSTSKKKPTEQNNSK